MNIFYSKNKFENVSPLQILSRGVRYCPNDDKYSPLEPSKLAVLTKFFTGLKTDAFYTLF